MTTSAPSPGQAAADATDDVERTIDGDVLVRISRVTKYYGRFKALDDVSLDIHRGEVVAVIGASGSGKSTLCRTVNRLEPIQKGEIEIDGVPLPQEGRALAQLRAEVGMVFQSFNLISGLTTTENVAAPLLYDHGTAFWRRTSRAEELLDAVGLASKAGMAIGRLSGGEQQRVAIARLLVRPPKVVLADEPTGALDHDNSLRVIGHLRDLADGGASVVVATHSDLVADSADQNMKVA